MIIQDYEIPKNSRFYFGDLAKRKRFIESSASEILQKYGFEEISTPLFSYNQKESVDENELIRVSDSNNNPLYLRADSTIDVVKLATKRIKKEKTNKWFYIQPVFRYPSSEFNQIGAEIIGANELGVLIDIQIDIFKKVEIEPLLHISNINIPIKIALELDEDISLFREGNLEKILQKRQRWLSELALLSQRDEIGKVISIAPDFIKSDLKDIRDLAISQSYDNLVIAALFYSKMRYYDGLFFRFIHKNSTISIGGSYECEGIESSGFAIYSDNLIDIG